MERTGEGEGNPYHVLPFLSPFLSLIVAVPFPFRVLIPVLRVTVTLESCLLLICHLSSHTGMERNEAVPGIHSSQDVKQL